MATPAAVEPRTSCPACGGPVHPIAGRCKHCKADLTRLRNGAAPATKAQPAARPNLVALGGGNGQSHGTNGASVQPSVAPPSSVMVPPPAEMAEAPRASWSSRWPLVVALIAVIAIVASVALLLFGTGDGKKKDRGVRRFDGPAPELTPTDPLAPQVTPPAPPPNPGQPHAGGIAPDPSQPDPVPGTPPTPPPSARPRTGPPTVSEFFTAALDTACQRMTTCSADDQVAAYCTMARQQLPQLGQSLDSLCPDYNGAAAADCLDAVSRFPCPSGTIDPMTMGDTLMGLSGCQKVCPSAFAGLAGGGAVGGSLGMTQ